MTPNKVKYAKVNAIIHMATRDAVLLSAVDLGSNNDQHWIPRSVISGIDDAKIAKAMRGDKMTVRIMEWKAQELGL